MKVNNRKCIYKMASKLLFANKRRNVITIFAIVLTAILFTSLFTIMLSINASYENSMFRQLGGNAHGTFKDVTSVQEEKLIKHKNIKAYGERMVLGLIEDGAFKNLSAEVSYMDEQTSKWSFVELEEGHLPTQKNEVVMDKEALRLLGYEGVLGESIELSFKTNFDSDESDIYTDTFTLVGYWEFDTLCPAHYINVSKDYALDFSKKRELLGYKPIRIDVDVMLSSSFNAWNKMIAAVEESGYSCGEKSTGESIRIGVNPGYTTTSMSGEEMFETLIPLAVFLLLVIFTGYLIIYNVFQISVTNDIRFYGLLKTIGTTQKQIKKIIRLQALALCLVGIPLGLLLGYFLGSVLTPTVIKTTTMSEKVLTISTSPVIFIAAAFFEICTVLLSVSKPGRMAGKVSPIEALRFNESVSSGKSKKATRGARVAQMAFANTGRNKKKTVLVVTSLALSLVILNAVNLFVGGFDSEKWLASSLSADFIVGKYPYFKFQGAGQDSISEQDIELIKENVATSKEGLAYEIKSLAQIKVSEEKYQLYQNFQIDDVPLIAENGGYYMNCYVEGMDDFLLDKVNVYEGDLSLLKEKEHRYIAIVTHKDKDGFYVHDEYAPQIGETITIADVKAITYYDSRTGKEASDFTYEHSEYLTGRITDITEYEYTVCAYVGVPTDISLRKTSFSYDSLVYAENLKEDFGENVVPVYYAFDTPSFEAEEKAEEFLHNFSQENDFVYESKALKRSEFEGLKKMFTVLGGALCLIIAFVGVLNFFNTVMAGIIARKNEIAVLQAIGMTGKQVKEMLIIEGMVYTLGSGLLALVLSLLFIPAVNGIANSLFWFYSPHFSISPVLMILPVLVLLGLLVPLLSYKGFSKASIVERIREL